VTFAHKRIVEQLRPLADVAAWARMASTPATAACDVKRTLIQINAREISGNKI
jgi:hypothetical protein